MSLTKCLKTAGKAVDEQRVRALREDYLKDGLDPKEAGKLAAADYLTELESERAALAARIESEGGVIDSPAFSFAGANARAPRGIAPLEVAQAYLDEGVDADAVRKLTGWFVGDYDGQWRFEFSDRNAKLKIALEQVPESKLFGGSALDIMKLEDVLEHDALFSAYPEARDIEFIKRPGFLDFGGLQGWFDGKNQIGLTPYVKDPIGTLLHEVQHWIQSQEGFATGGNESSAIENLSPELLAVLAEDLSKDMEKSLIELDEARSALIKLTNDSDVTVALMRYIVLLKKRDEGLSQEELKADRDERQKRYNEFSKEALRVFGREYSLDLSKAERKAMHVLVVQPRPLASLDADVVEVQKAFAGIRSGDLKALTKAAKATGAAYNLYRRIAGEIEARNVPTRKDMSDEDLMIFHPRDTVEEEIQQLDKKDIIVVFDKSGGSSVVEVDADLAEEVSAGNQEVQFSVKGKAPQKTITAYKLFHNRKGKLHPLFAGKSLPTPVGEWVDAEVHPTKGLAPRPGWHAGVLPLAPHLRDRTNQRAAKRVWAEVELPADVDWQSRADLTPTKDIKDEIPVGGHYRFKRKVMEGGAWIIGGALKVNRVLSDAEVAQILTEAGHAEEVEAETRGAQFSRGPRWSSTLSKTFMDQGGTSRSGREWASWIQGNRSKFGVKSEEVEWSGLTEFLELLGKEKVSGGAIGQWVADNGVQVLETDYTGRDTRYEQYAVPEGRDYTELLLHLEDPTHKTITRFQVIGAFPAHFDTKEEAEEYVARVEEAARSIDRIAEALKRHPFSIQKVDESVVVPEAKGAAFTSAHWTPRNILVHARYDTRQTTGGEQVLFVQEIQSDWAQEGRKKGFAGPAPTPVGEVVQRSGEWGVLDEDGNFWRSANFADAMRSAGREPPPGVPAGPFVQETKAWITLALKRLIQAAVDSGAETVAWTTGAQQASRFSLENKVGEIRWFPREEGRGTLVVYSTDEDHIVHEEMEESKIEDYIGKELSEKLLAQPLSAGSSPGGVPGRRRTYQSISGSGLKIGGEGMKEFYDRIVPRAANELIKKYGSKVEPVELILPDDAPERYVGPSYTSEQLMDMSEDSETLEDLSNIGGTRLVDYSIDTFRYAADLMDNGFEFEVAIDVAMSADTSTRLWQMKLSKYLGGWWGRKGEGPSAQLGFKVTEKMREAAEQGMPMFSRQRRGAPPLPGQVRSGQRSLLPGAPSTNTVAGQVSHAPRFPSVKNAHEKLVDRINKTFSSPLSGLIQESDYRTIRGLTHGRVAIVDELTAELNKKLGKMSEAQNARALRYLKTKGAPVPNLGDADLERTVKSVKDTFTSLGQQMVDRGMIPQESFDKLGEAYVPRIYLIHLFGDANQRSELASGKLPDLSRTKARKDIPQELRELMGEVDNVAFLASTGVGQEMRDVALIDWLDEVAKNANWVLQEDLMEWEGKRVTPHALLSFAERLRSMADYQGTEPQKQAATLAAAQAMDTAARQHIASHQRNDPAIAKNYLAIPDTARYGNLRGLRVKREIYNDIVAGRDAAAEVGLIEMTFAAGGPLAAKGTALFKEMKVVQNPVSHVRNYIANGVLAHLAGIPFAMVPIRQAQALAAVLGSNPRYTKYYGIAKKYGLTSGTFASQELNQAKTEYRKYLLRHEKSGFKKIGHALAIASDTLRQPLRKLYQGEEAVWKVAALIHAMESKKMSVGDAATWANDALMDYSDVTPTVRALRNSPYGMPFATFQSKATARVLETAVTRPWAFVPYAVIAATMGQMLMDTLGDVDDDDWEALKKNMPKWAQERASATILPFKDEHGRWVTIDFSAFLPWAQQIDAVKLLGEGRTPEATKQLGLFTGPMSSIIIAWTTGEDVFTGRPIYNEWDEGRVKAGKMINYVMNMWIPPVLSTMDNSIGNKLIDFAQGRPSPTGDATFTPGQMAARVAGVNVYPFVPFEERKKIINKEKFMISKLKAERSKIMRDQSLSDKEKDKEFERLSGLIEERRQEIFKYREESEIPASME